MGIRTRLITAMGDKMEKYREMLNCGTTAQMVLLMESDGKLDSAKQTLDELMDRYREQRDVFELDTLVRPPDPKEVLRGAAEICNTLYGVMWYCDKVMKIMESKERAENVKKNNKRMARNS